jgi:glycosyltransferase involved in cell wall biosynthesis
MIVTAGNQISGIGQVCEKYAKVFGTEPTKDLYETFPEDESIFIFALPIPYYMDRIKELSGTNHILCMTVCETEPVNPVYGELFKLLKKFFVPSEFCRSVFSKQFPDNEFVVLPHVVSPLNDKISKLSVPSSNPYIFYHIGNILDPRKQIKKIIEAFMRLHMDNCILVLKASCLQQVKWNFPNIFVINEFMSDNQIEILHNTAHCYVSFSNSEGVGMGAVEAAVRNKPVIISEYGGATDYIKTPYTIKCEPKQVGYNDFLFTPDLWWGKPSFQGLCEFMMDAYKQKLKYMDHTHTREYTSIQKILPIVSGI